MDAGCEQRSQLYADLLIEVYVEARYINGRAATPRSHDQAAILSEQDDLHTSAMARAQLAARATNFGSQDIIELFDELISAISRAAISPKDVSHGKVNNN